MSNQLFEIDIKNMTINMLKEVLNVNDWPAIGLRLKVEYIKQVILCSYNDTQLKGIQEMCKI